MLIHLTITHSKQVIFASTEEHFFSPSVDPILNKCKQFFATIKCQSIKDVTKENYWHCRCAHVLSASLNAKCDIHFPY